MLENSEQVLILGFVKFGIKENLLKLLNQGELFFNTFSAFVQMNDKFRGDIFEGADNIISGHKIKSLTYRNPLGKKIDLMGQDFSVEYVIDRRNWENKPTHLYSLYMIKCKEYTNTEKVIDERNLKFGNYAVCITKPEEFICRVKNKLEKEEIPFMGKPISYVNVDDIKNNYNLFKKPIAYEYQNEFRFLIKSSSLEPVKIQIGSLNDISVLLSAREICSIRIS